MAIINKSKIRDKVKEVQGNFVDVTSIADEVELEMEKKAEEVLQKAIERARANNRRTLLARDL
jgi:hypothetical protein